MINLNGVSIENINLNAQGNDEIYQNLQILYTTPAGTVPFDREFGINYDLLDNPTPIAQGRLIVEYIEKTRKYEPRVSVKEVNFETNEDGSIIPKVVIEFDNNAE